MPFIDIVAADDYASIYYWANTPTGSVSAFDPAKPTVILMHGLLLGSEWTYPQSEDPRLNAGFNLLAIDTRSSGQSRYKASGRFDLWVVAADLAHVFHHLGLPPAHIFTPEIYGYATLRFAALFPELCLSVTLCNIPAQTELRTVFDAWEELAPHWTHAEDLESMEYCIKEILGFFTTTEQDHITPEMLDLHDDLAAWWEVMFPPFRRSMTVTNLNLVSNRTPMTPEELAAVKSPVLIIQAERSVTHPMQHAQELAQALTGVPNGVSLYNVRAAYAYLAIISASIVNQTFLKWLKRQPPVRSELSQNGPPLAERMAAALKQLSIWQKDPSIAQRDPLSPLSFSCLAEEVVRSQQDLQAEYEKGARAAFSPLGMDGRPLRKYSERQDHWLDIGADGYSHIDVRRLQQDRERILNMKRSVKASTSKPPPMGWRAPDLGLLRLEPVTERDQQVARAHRGPVDPSLVAEKNVIKGSMAKVVASSSNPIPRLLR